MRDAIVDVLVVTDMQQAGFTQESLDAGALEFPDTTQLSIHDVGRPVANNIAVTNLHAGATSLPPDRPLNLQATVFNYGALPFEEVAVLVSAVSGQRSRRMRKTINIPNGQAQELEFDFGTLETGVWEITLDVDVEDDLMVDNRRRTAVSIAGPTDVLIIADHSEPGIGRDAGYYVQTALDQTLAVGGSTLMFKTLAVDIASARAHLEKQPAVAVLSNLSVLQPTFVSTLTDYVRQGGRLLFLTGDTVRADVAQALNESGLAPGKLRTRTTSGISPYRIVHVSTRGKMLDPFRDPQHGDLGKLQFATILPTELDAECEVHAWFEDDRPAITEHKLGIGSAVWFLGSTDGRSSNTANSPLFLPLLHQMLAELLDLTGEGKVRLREVGESAIRLVSDSTEPTEEETADEQEATNRDVFVTPGFERTSDATFVVNVPASESDTARGEVETLSTQFALPLSETEADAAGSSPTVQATKQHELWPWLCALALALIVFEFALANRTPA